MALDRFALYERAVQCAEHEVEFFRRVFRAARGRDPVTLREDFAGTAAVSVEWVRAGPEHEAWAVDHDEACLAWAREHHLASLGDDERRRLHLVHDDVHAVAQRRADVVAAENFSWCVFRTRDALRTYLEAALGNLGDEGLLVLDIQGGPATQREGLTERRELDDGAVMEWTHERFDPVSHRVRFRMSFARGDERLDDAFSYDWRLWTLPELSELCLEAGFSRVETWWQDEEGKRAGRYRRVEEAPAAELWVAYVVAQR
jgi:hypothetical protein